MVAAKKNIAIVAVFIAVGLAFYFYKEYHRKPDNISGFQPAEKINFSIIVNGYQNDETIANKQYLGKIIQVAGPIADIIKQQDTIINVFIGDINSLHKVSCLLDKRNEGSIDKYSKGNDIIIKGICTGFLLDVELNRCVIVDTGKQ